jgi:hypothetical protein
MQQADLTKSARAELDAIVAEDPDVDPPVLVEFMRRTGAPTLRLAYQAHKFEQLQSKQLNEKQRAAEAAKRDASVVAQGGSASAEADFSVYEEKIADAKSVGDVGRVVLEKLRKQGVLAETG